MDTPTRPRARRLLGLALAATTALFTTTATANVQRGYELVTPADDGLYDVSVPWTNLTPPLGAVGARRSTPDGEHVVFTLNNGAVGVGETLPGVAPDGEMNDYGIASRGATGWDLDVPLADRSSVGGCTFEGEQIEFDTISQDGGTFLLRAKCRADKVVFGGGLDQVAPPGYTLYAADVATDATSFLGAKMGPEGPVPRFGLQADLDEDHFVGGSSDLSMVYFATRAGLLPDMPDLVGNSGYLYRWGPEGTELVSKSAVGVPFGVTLRHDFSLPDAGGLERPNVVSAAGDAVTMTIPRDRSMVAADSNGVADVYQVRDGEPIWVSQPTRSPAPAPAPRVFQGVSADGGVVVFTTTEPMTNDDQDSRKDLFVADLETGELIRASTGPLNDNGDLVADESHFVTLSDDGSHVYFITGSQLVSEDVDGGSSLYVRNLESGTTLFVAPATAPIDGDAATERSLVDELTPVSGRWIKLSDDGRVAFVSLATDVSLPAGRGGPDADATRDLFVWREDDGLRRIRQGADPDANTGSLPGLGCFGQESKGVGYPVACRAMTTDGGLVILETDEALSPADVNNEFDVYAMHTVDGSIELISPAGPGMGPARYVDTSATGHHVFFLTSETLDPERDLDGGREDIYSARVGEVFGPPPPPNPPCVPGVDCALPTPPLPVGPPLGSSRLGAAESVFPPRRVVVTVRRPGRRLLRRAARSGVLPLRVRLSAPGRVTAIAKARVGGRLRTVATARRRLETAGSARLVLRLSAPARRQLGLGKAVHMSIQVRTSGARAEAMTITLRASR